MTRTIETTNDAQAVCSECAHFLERPDNPGVVLHLQCGRVVLCMRCVAAMWAALVARMTRDNDTRR